MSNKTKKVALIGWPIAHSLSPAMHNAAFVELGLDDWSYVLLPTQADSLGFDQEKGIRGYSLFKRPIPVS